MHFIHTVPEQATCVQLYMFDNLTFKFMCKN